MGEISLQSPIVGLPNSTEDPKITSDFNTLQTLLNGNVDTANLNDAAGVLVTQLDAKARGLVVSPTAGSATLVDRQLAVYTGSTAATFVLPSPALNVQVGVFVGGPLTGAQQLTVTTPTGIIAGKGVATASIGLGFPNAFVRLHGDGTNYMIAGGARDTGWVALTGGITAGVFPSGGYTPAARLIDDRVWLRGILYNGSGSDIAPATALAQIPVALEPAQIAVFWREGLTAVQLNGQIQFSGVFPAGSVVPLDGLSYSIV